MNTISPELQTKLDSIKPGVNYPRSVKIVESVEGKGVELVFLLQSYCVGMYCAIHFNKAPIPHQTGDHDNKKFVTGLKRDIKKAIERGATVELGTIAEVEKI